MQGATKKKCTNLKLSPEAHKTAKATAALLGEGFYQFVEIAIQERLGRLRADGKVRI